MSDAVMSAKDYLDKVEIRPLIPLLSRHDELCVLYQAVYRRPLPDEDCVRHFHEREHLADVLNEMLHDRFVAGE